ncbi:T9SS type B sorting domain-containing protein [Polaribacter vadi]|uniref:T9SS type B sorting domain-containing protein n=1 Tax=Polaribacter TaxID=52959 RepID=UPI001C08903A|nr:MULTISPECIES: T9SS type B sorting domain-containing protein [Polaribacter]MBU3011686.1 T9SS type B sorting domain-containing protein [Polaribacter vadi]MDO6741499.1 T9SS type B sorting domain-containing protein [Polaribacter sp. 1_MG-2023]
MKKLLPFFIFIFTINLFSQKEANIWYFGQNAGLDFSTSPPTALTDGQINTDEGCSSFSSPTGELLFYSDGIEVYTKEHRLMTYSDGSLANNLKGNPSSTQSGMIIPKPGSTTIYYLFTVGTDFVGSANNPNPGFNFYTIDMSKNSGLGEITRGPTNLAINPNTNTDNSSIWSEKVAAVKGADCNVYWVVSYAGNTFYSYKITDAGVDISNIITSQVNFSASDKRGYLQVSPNGKKIAFADFNSSGSNISGSLVLFDFDNATGKVDQFSSETLISRFSGESPYGVSFSPQSNKLYASSYNGGFSVFQFDLESSNIAASKKTIVNRNGYRGALQLAPDGKIYASIPDSFFLDVIENPDEDADKVVYTENAVNLNGRLTDEGLPPFISSLLLPIEILDTDTNVSINNTDAQFCIGQDKTIISEDITGTGATYSWTFDDGINPPTDITPTTNPGTLVLTNIQLSNAGEYALKIEITDDCGVVTQYNGTFNVEVFEAAYANKPDDIYFCDIDRNGFNKFDFQADLNNEILDGLDPKVFDVLYFNTLDDANSGNNPLPNPYNNPTAFSSETIYARVQNTNAIDACFAITDFVLAVTDYPTPTQPQPYRICDNTESSSDTDGIVNTFLLNTKDSEILGSLNSTQYLISYHTTQIGAENNDVATIVDKDSNYSVTNSQTLYIRVENKDNFGCYDANTSIELIVDSLPDTTQEVDLLQCDDDLDRVSTVNLTEAEISISTNSQNETFEYFATETDAIAGTPEVADKLRYPVNQTGEAWVRTISDQNCYRISKINLSVEASADVIYYKEFPAVCDDFLQKDGTDGTLNDDTDGITNFDFSDANTEILAFFPVLLQPDLEVSYYETTEDRTAVINAIVDISNYRNTAYPSNITRQTIYFKITNKNNNNCSGTGELYLKTNSVPTAEIVPDLELCDDVLDGDTANGIVQYFDLESQTTDILNGQNATDFTVTYHDSKTDANVGIDELTSPFENTIRDSQPIYVRVTNNTTGCFTDHTSFNLVVNPVPIANFVDDLEVCDDNSDGSARNGFSQSIDLESQTAGILGTQDSNIHTVTYHRSLADAQSGNLPLVSPYTNNTQDRETIYVRILNTNSMCVNGISNFDVIVNPEPTFETPTNLAYCDDDLDGDDANGIVQNIDLDSKITEILGASQSPNDFNVTFHKSQTDATSGDDPVVSPYQNTNTTETFYVRIQNKQTLCVNDDATFDVIVNPLPDIMVTTPQILCLNDLPLNISAESPRDVYTYVWKDENGNTLNTTSVDNIDVTTAGKYTVTATTTNGTFCERVETIEVNASNIATLESSFITIIDESNNISSEDNLSVSIDVINNDLGPGDYQFAIINTTENNERIPMIGFQDEPLFENLEGGIYTIIVNDKNGCSPDTTLDVSVIQFPKYFTPNADGYNDTWVVKGANKTFYPNASINIFNRYGKLVAQEPIDSQGWDGMYQGKLLPSDDYWYNITLIPADTNKPTINKKGNFSLLRK